MLNVSWTAKKTNQTVLKETDIKFNLLDRIKTQQAKFVDHDMRGHSLEHILTIGKMDGKRERGRKREKICDGLARWTGEDEGLTSL